MASEIRHDWRRDELLALFDLPLPELLYRAARVHREHFDPAEVQVSTLLSVKTGGCPEDCAYCPQAQRYHTGVQATKLMDTEQVLEKARQAKAAGASRLCMGAAWRSPRDPRLGAVMEGQSLTREEADARLKAHMPDEENMQLADGVIDTTGTIENRPEQTEDIINPREAQAQRGSMIKAEKAGGKPIND